MTLDERMDVEIDSNNNQKKSQEDGVRVRVWCDGCYDLAHFGHANSLRQAKGKGDYLVVGVHSDAEIRQHKGCSPVLNEEERYEMIRSIKWVDEVIEAAPYVTTIETLDKHNCAFSAHGDDITTNAEGVDTYQEVKENGRYEEVKRTQGVSTTNLINRMLGNDRSKGSQSSYTGANFLATTNKIVEFLQMKNKNGLQEKHDLVVYAPGAYDLFHPGHISFLKAAKKLGKNVYTIIGIYGDQTLSQKFGRPPIQNLFERLQNVLSCKYVDDIVIDAPFNIDKELLTHFNVDLVLHGLRTRARGTETHLTEDPFSLPKKIDKFKEIKSSSDLRTEDIIKRVQDQKDVYKKRNEDKERKERLIQEQQEQSKTMEAEQ